MYAIWNDEGKVEGEFLSQDAADEAIHNRYLPEDDLHSGYECDEHPGHEAVSCELCNDPPASE
jgi:hypothetical protein